MAQDPFVARVGEVFKLLDVFGTGKLSVDRFREVVSVVYVGIDEDDFDDVMADFDTHNTGSISKEEWHTFFGNADDSVKEALMGSDGDALLVDLEARRQKTLQDYRVKELFEAVDITGDGTLLKGQFKAVAARVYPTIDADDLDDLLAEFGDHITIDDWMKFFENVDDGTLQLLASETGDAILQELQAHKVAALAKAGTSGMKAAGSEMQHRVRELFSALDVNDSGKLALDEVSAIVCQVYADLDEDDLEDFMADFGAVDGFISAEQWTAFFAKADSSTVDLLTGETGTALLTDLQGKKVVKVAEARLTAMFGALDTAGAGVLSMEEFKKAAAVVYPDLDDDDLEDLLTNIDISAGINLEQWLQFFKQAGEDTLELISGDAGAAVLSDLGVTGGAGAGAGAGAV